MGTAESEYADIQQRVYRGDIDTPKTHNSVRHAALSDGLIVAIDKWPRLAARSIARRMGFPSERLVTPVGKDNCWRRSFGSG